LLNVTNRNINAQSTQAGQGLAGVLPVAGAQFHGQHPFVIVQQAENVPQRDFPPAGRQVLILQYRYPAGVG
jgi:hypothetical protein